MESRIIVFGIFFTIVIGDQIPAGFVPLPPIPGNFQPLQPKTQAPPISPRTKKSLAPSTQKIIPPKTKVPAKTTPPPITKKPTTVKINKPVATKAPLTQRATRTTTNNCQFSFNVPNSNCQGGNSAVQQTLTYLRQQLTQARQQHQAQNAALQSTISQLQMQQSGYVMKIADLQNEVQNLVAAFNSLSSGQGSSTAAPIILPSPTASVGNPSVLKQAIQNVKTNLRDAVKDLDTKFFNLSLVLNDNQAQDSKIHQSLESQLLRQSSDITRLSQQISDLSRLLQQVPTNTTGSAMTSADVAKLQSQIQQVSSDIQRYDSQQQSKITNLTSASSALQAAINQQSSDIRDAKNNAHIAQSRIGVAENDIKRLHDSFAQFRQLREPQIIGLDKDVKDLSKNISTINTGLDGIRNTTFNFAQMVTRTSQQLLPLKLQTLGLGRNVTNLQNDLASQKTEIGNIKKGFQDLKNAVPLQTLNDMNNIILQIVSNQPVFPQQLTTLKNDLQTLQQRLQRLYLPPVPAG